MFLLIYTPVFVLQTHDEERRAVSSLLLGPPHILQSNAVWCKQFGRSSTLHRTQSDCCELQSMHLSAVWYSEEDLAISPGYLWRLPLSHLLDNCNAYCLNLQLFFAKSSPSKRTCACSRKHTRMHARMQAHTHTHTCPNILFLYSF